MNFDMIALLELHSYILIALCGPDFLDDCNGSCLEGVPQGEFALLWFCPTSIHFRFFFFFFW